MTDRLTRQWLNARDGDRGDFADAVRGAQADVWRFVRHLVGPQLADEVTQDTFVRAWRALPQFRAESTARTWLLAIARRAAADAIRRVQRDRRLRRALPTQRGAVDDGADAHGIATLIQTLGDDQREAFVLTQLIGLSYDEAAVVAGVPIGTIRSRVARARQQLTITLAEAAEA